MSIEWVHVRCGKAHEVDQECPSDDSSTDALGTAAARLAAVSGVRDDLKRRLEAGHPPTAKDILTGLDKALERKTLVGPRMQDVEIVPDEQGFATARHSLDSESITAVRAWTEDGVGCQVVSCLSYGLDEVEVLTAPEARTVRLMTIVAD